MTSIVQASDGLSNVYPKGELPARMLAKAEQLVEGLAAGGERRGVGPRPGRRAGPASQVVNADGTPVDQDQQNLGFLPMAG